MFFFPFRPGPATLPSSSRSSQALDQDPWLGIAQVGTSWEQAPTAASGSGRVWEQRVCGRVVRGGLVPDRISVLSHVTLRERRGDARSLVLSVRLGTRHAKPAEHALSLSSVQGDRQNWAVNWVQAGSEEARRAGSETGRQCCSP